MTGRSLEFRISQLADGNLPAEEREALRATLEADAKARQTHAEYRRLHHKLDHALAMPPVRWDTLAEHLSATVAASAGRSPIEQHGVVGRIAHSAAVWQRRAAVAASILLAAGAGLFAWHGRPAHRPVTLPLVSPSSVVVGPQAEVARGTASVQITVGPSPALAQQGGEWHYAEGVVVQPPKVQFFSKASPPAADDPHLH